MSGRMSPKMGGNLERRYRRVLRLLPGWYRERWEQDMVAAFLDSWLTGDPEADAYISQAAGPSWAEVASVAALAARLYLVGAGTPRRFAWGQAIRRAALAVTLLQAVRGLDILVRTAWGRGLIGWLPAPPAGIIPGSPGGLLPPAAWYLVACAWVAAFVLLVLRQYRAAQVIAAMAIVPDLVWLVQGQLTGAFAAPTVGPWAFWALLNLAPVAAMTAFRRGGPRAAGPAWLLALPAGYLLVAVPLLLLQVTGNSEWLPDFSGLCCVLVALACLAHAPRAWSRRAAGSGVWSLALVLLAVEAGAYRLFSLSDYLSDPHLISVSLTELLIVVMAAALVAPDAARAPAAAVASSASPHPA
jgi:hypothetical protein